MAHDTLSVELSIMYHCYSTVWQNINKPGLKLWTKVLMKYPTASSACLGDNKINIVICSFIMQKWSELVKRKVKTNNNIIND